MSDFFTKVWGDISKAAAGLAQLRAGRILNGTLEFSKANNVSGDARIKGQFSEVNINPEPEEELNRWWFGVLHDHSFPTSSTYAYKRTEYGCATPKGQCTTPSKIRGNQTYNFFVGETLYGPSIVGSAHSNNGNVTAPYETGPNDGTGTWYRSKQTLYFWFGVNKHVDTPITGWEVWADGFGCLFDIVGKRTHPSDPYEDVGIAIYPKVNTFSDLNDSGFLRRELRMFVTSGRFGDNTGTTYILPDPPGSSGRDLDVNHVSCVPHSGVMVFLATARMMARLDGTSYTYTNADRCKAYIGIITDYGDYVSWIEIALPEDGRPALPPAAAALSTSATWYEYDATPYKPPTLPITQFNYDNEFVEQYLSHTTLVPISDTKVLMLTSYEGDATTRWPVVAKLIDTTAVTATDVTLPLPTTFYDDPATTWYRYGVMTSPKQVPLRPGVLLLRLFSIEIVDSNRFKFRVLFLRTPDYGANWEVVTPTGLPTDAFTVVTPPLSPAYEEVLSSCVTNMGYRFEVIESRSTSSKVMLVCRRGNKAYRYISADDGDTWKAVPESIGAYDPEPSIGSYSSHGLVSNYLDQVFIFNLNSTTGFGENPATGLLDLGTGVFTFTDVVDEKGNPLGLPERYVL